MKTTILPTTLDDVLQEARSVLVLQTLVRFEMVSLFQTWHNSNAITPVKSANKTDDNSISRLTENAFNIFVKVTTQVRSASEILNFTFQRVA